MIKNQFLAELRPVAFVLLPTLYFLGWSIYLLVSNEPDWFARLGSAMIAWAIFNLSVGREKYSVASIKWDRYRVVAHLNQMRELQKLQEETLDLTFNIHASQIAQIALAIGAPNPFVEDTPEAVEQFAKSVQERMETSTVHERSTALISKMRELEREYGQGMRQNLSWSKLIWSMEACVLIWGTLQWGYGDLFVIWFHGTQPLT